MYSQKRFALFTVILLYLQQPAIASLPQEGGGVWVFTALSGHAKFDVGGTDSSAELCGVAQEIQRVTPQGYDFVSNHDSVVITATEPRVEEACCYV